MNVVLGKVSPRRTECSGPTRWTRGALALVPHSFTTLPHVPHSFAKIARVPYSFRALGLVLLASVFSFVLIACGSPDPGKGGANAGTTDEVKTPSPSGSASSSSATEPAGGKPKYVLAHADTAGLTQAIFAGGCFWCIETAFEGVEGVHAVISGYAGGPEPNPTYEQVGSGQTGHAESVLVTFDPKVVSYGRLLEIFWVNHDPLTANRQFCDGGPQYRPAIFPLDQAQESEAKASVAWASQHLGSSGKIVTEITLVSRFWPAEEYHQDYYKKDPVTYQRYRTGCGRDRRLIELWGKNATVHP